MTVQWLSHVAKDPNAPWILNELLKVGGFYRTPTDDSGRWIGPLVGYAGTYAPGKHWVGDTYLDFGLLEMLSIGSIQQAARAWCDKYLYGNSCPSFDMFVTVPSGGNVFGTFLAAETERRYAALQKLVTVASEGGKRSESEFVLDRHIVGQGARVLLVEDIINNRSSALKARELVEAADAVVVGYVATWSRAQNPSPDGLPTLALVDIPLLQWRQNEPDIASMVEGNRIAWKPRALRSELGEIMIKHPLLL